MADQQTTDDERRMARLARLDNALHDVARLEAALRKIYRRACDGMIACPIGPGLAALGEIAQMADAEAPSHAE